MAVTNINDSGGSFSFGNNLNSKSIIIFGCDMSLVLTKQIVKIVFMFWVKILFKVLMEQLCMQKNIQNRFYRTK